MDEQGKAPEFKPYHHPAAGWGAAKSVTEFLVREGELVDGPRAIMRMNHENGGFDCPGCAWPDDRKGLHLDICENGIKHVDLGDDPQAGRPRVLRRAHGQRAGAAGATSPSKTQGRLTEPMVYDAATRPLRPDHLARRVRPARPRPCEAWTIPTEAAFYTSGRLSNEATFLYQLLAREFGTNNLPDCSNMCHEASGRALTAALGTGKGTVDLDDWESADAPVRHGRQRRIQRAADAHLAGRGLPPRRADRARQPAGRGGRDPDDRAARDSSTMATFQRHADQHAEPPAAHRRRHGAAARHGQGVLEAARTDPKADRPEFIERYTTGFAGLPRAVRGHRLGGARAPVGRRRGSNPRQRPRSTARPTARIISWCLGVTQHEHGVDTVREIVNLLLLRGNLGREGAGPSPGARAQQRAGQPHLRHRPPPGRRVPRPARRRSATSTRRASTASTPSASIEAMHARRGEGVRRHGRQLRPRRARHRLHRRRLCATAS